MHFDFTLFDQSQCAYRDVGSIVGWGSIRRMSRMNPSETIECIPIALLHMCTNDNHLMASSFHAIGHEEVGRATIPFHCLRSSIIEMWNAMVMLIGLTSSQRNTNTQLMRLGTGIWMREGRSENGHLLCILSCWNVLSDGWQRLLFNVCEQCVRAVTIRTR